MGFQINTNITSLQAQHYLNLNGDFQAKTINRVTSGLRIVQSGDDAAGLAIANGFRSDQAVLGQGIRNANDGLSQLQIADGGINNISQLLDRARTLATQSASGTFSGDRGVLNDEFQSVLTEIDRQAQSIGLDTGGKFATNLSVFIGGGSKNANISAIQNGSVSIDLSNSTVDSRSLGLKGVQTVNGTTYNLAASSDTSVQKIAQNTNNTNSLTNGYSNFYFAGPGFSDSSKVEVSVNMSGVASTDTLIGRINDAIATAGDQGTAQATAFKNANVTASISTDASGNQRLTFTSASAAFSVQAGDKMANALMGNFKSGSAPEGDDLVNTSAAASTVNATAAKTITHSNGIVVRVMGGGLTDPVDLKVSTTAGTTTVQNVLDALTTAASQNSTLQAAGITMSGATTGGTLTFTNKLGQAVDFQVSNDADNIFGAGTWQSGTAGSFDASTVTAPVNFATITTATAGTRTLQFSFDGGPKVGVSIALANGDDKTVAVQKINDAIAKDATLGKTDIKASLSGNQIVLSSALGTKFRVNEVSSGAASVTGGTITLASCDFSSGAKDFKIGITDATGTVAPATINLTANDSGGIATLVADVQAKVNAAIGTGRVTVGNVGNALTLTLASAGVNSTITLQAGSSDALGVLQLTAGTTTADEALGFNAGVNQTANTISALTDNNTQVAGGAAQTDAYGFKAIKFGGNSQTITFSANDTTGNTQSTAVVLTAANATTLDDAINAINSALQKTSDPTLQRIAAVKDRAGSADGIRFISTLTGFSVGFSQADDEGSGAVGIGGTDAVQGTTVNSTTDTTKGGTADIATQSTAQNAVTALADAVTNLGKAQAVVGRGENNFNYAVNLAQSQVTNLAAAESRIRDADLAAEAANMTKAQILMQAGIAALAQANSAPQQVLSLLRG